MSVSLLVFPKMKLFISWKMQNPLAAEHDLSSRGRCGCPAEHSCSVSVLNHSIMIQRETSP